jgi:molybdopterin-dependent oxidoreductase alpha subunit
MNKQENLNMKKDDPNNHYGVKDKPEAVGQLYQNDVPLKPVDPEVLKANPPEDHTNIQIGQSSESAAGVPGVISTMKHTFNEMGVTRSIKMLLEVNKKNGFDCQGCAWPNPDDKSHMLEFCENGAKAIAYEATTKRITEDFFRKWSIDELLKQSDYWLGQQGRLTRPMILREGERHYAPISWEEAFKLVAQELNNLGSPDEAIFYTSGRTSNEAAFLYQLFVRQFGTNNLPDCSNMCHESSGTALVETIGIGKGTVTIKDFELADTIFIIGQNPGTNHPRMLSSLEAAKRNGCKIVSINPLPEIGNFRFKNPQDFKNPVKALPTLLGKGTKLSDLFLQVRINGDNALFKGIMKVMLEEEERQPGTVLDQEFIRNYTIGFNNFTEALKAISWEDIVEQSGIPIESIKEAAQIAIQSKRMICCWAMGLTQHKDAVSTIQEIVNFALLRGQIGKPGAGLCPVRGHSNVQGDRTMGIWERPSETFLDNLSKEFNFEPPRHHGYDTVKAINAMYEGKAKVFFAMGGNFLSATPDTFYTAEALRRCRLTAHVSTKLNRAHLITGKAGLILPCLGRTEVDMQTAGPQFVTVEDSMGVINSSRGSLKPASEYLLSEPMIVAKLANATLGNKSKVDWKALTGDYNLIRKHISHVIPGFEDYNSRISEGSFYLPNAARERVFKTDSGRAQFTVHDISKWKLGPDQYLMTTIRSHDQFNTSIYGLDDRYRGVYKGRRVILMNADDIKDAGLNIGQLVNITSHFDGEKRSAYNFKVVSYDIPRKCAATYFPEANLLIPIGSVAEKSNTPTSKSIIITIDPA